jgi:AI-2 transport protein TqsA
MTQSTGTRKSLRRLSSFALTFGIVLASYFVLSKAKDFLIPLVIAFIFVYMVDLLNRLLGRIRIGGTSLPRAASFFLSFAVIFVLGFLFIVIVADNARHVAEEAPRFQMRFQHMQSSVFKFFKHYGVEEPPELRELMRAIDLKAAFTAVASALASLLENVTLVFIYGLFILLELRFVESKFTALFPEPVKRGRALEMLKRIDKEIQNYIRVKTLVSLTTALLSYLLMRIVNLDFAEFWALLILVLHFIPTIGVIIATLLPTVIAAIQFDRVGPFLVVGIGLALVAQLMGNIVEPNAMGETLNLSPLAVIISLIFWGTLWGIVGAFLCVPLTVITLMILSNFESTRWIAVLLSKTGRVT